MKGRSASVLVLGGALTIVAAAAFAQAAETAAPTALSVPRGSVATDYLAAVAGRRFQTEISYLPANAPLDGAVRAPDEAAEPPETGDIPAALQGAGWVVLAIFLAGALFLTVRNRHALAEIFGRSDRSLFGDAAGAATETSEEIDYDLLRRLRAEADPRVGLRLVLKRFLALAARENDIALRRSLTTRELIRLLPGGWRHRGDLEALATRVELVVFGGRAIDRQTYEECIDLAAPLLFRVEPA